MKKKVLGRGLGALIPESEHSQGTPAELDLDLIAPNPDQPRSRYNDQRIEELAASIRTNGVLQPVLVRPMGSGYQLVAGERRLMAAQRAGLLRIPAVVREVPDDRLLELALVENIQREELNPVEEAQAFQRLIDTLRITQEELAGRLGKERSTVANGIRLLKLPPAVKEMVAEGRISPGHARALLSTDISPSEMTKAAMQMAEQGWSVRDAERWAKRRPHTVRKAEPQDPNVAAATDRLRLLLGTKVEIVGGRVANRAGQIRIHFYNAEDLTRIYGILTERRA